MQRIGNNIVVFPEQTQMIVRLTDPVHQQAVGTLPSVQRRGDLFQMPWTPAACRYLLNLGVSEALEAAPICFDTLPLIEGRFKPMHHQLMIAAYMTLYPRSYDLASPRLGKTAATILGLDYLQRIRAITGGVLIITTLTTIHGVWKSNLETTLPHARIAVVHGSQRVQALKTPADFYITNYDSCRLSEQAFMEAAKAGRIGAVVIDELTHVGNSTSKRSKAIYNICNKTGINYVWGLTGSPADNPDMVYGMCRVVNQAKLPCTTKSGWMQLTTYQYGPQPFMRAPSTDAPRIIQAAMQPAIRYNKADILDLPPVTTQVRTCSLSSEQERMRRELRQEAVALLESGEQITAANGGVLLTKLMQVALGIVKQADGVPVMLDHKERTQVLLEAIAETSRKVVIFCGYTAGIKMMVEEIQGAGYTCDMVDGSVTGLKRAKILHDFQNTKDPRVLVCHPTTTAMGVELSAADTMIFNGVPMTGGFVYAQSIERLSSTKQKADNINIIHILATPEERRALASLQQGYDLGQKTAELFEGFASSRD